MTCHLVSSVSEKKENVVVKFVKLCLNILVLNMKMQTPFRQDDIFLKSHNKNGFNLHRKDGHVPSAPLEQETC